MTSARSASIFVEGHGGNEWLAQTVEPTLEPDLPICDPHHHFWDETPVRQPYHRYLLDDLAADVSSGHNIRTTVYIEAGSSYRADGPELLRPVGEVEFAAGQAATSATGLHGPWQAAAAIVGRADLMLGERVAPVLDALQAASPNRFRGIRHSVTWESIPELAATGQKAPGLLGEARFREGAQVLANANLSFEAWLYHPQLAELAAFAKAVPDLTIVLNHVGGLTRVGPYASREHEVMAAWRADIAAVAACPNVVIKLGGLGMPRFGFGYHTRTTPVGSEELAADLAPLLTYCIEQFGPERCMFESNFPVDKVSYSYNVLFNAFKRLSAGYSVSERAAMFHDTATRVYRIS
jgi:L-fuconolactonase